MERPWKKIQRQLWQGRQSWNLGSFWELDSGHMIEVRIVVDAHDFQSSAVAWVLTEAGGWKRIVSIPYPKMLSIGVNYTARKLNADQEAALISDEKRLLLLAHRLLVPSGAEARLSA